MDIYWLFDVILNFGFFAWHWNGMYHGTFLQWNTFIKNMAGTKNHYIFGTASNSYTINWLWTILYNHQISNKNKFVWIIMSSISPLSLRDFRLGFFELFVIFRIGSIVVVSNWHFKYFKYNHWIHWWYSDFSGSDFIDPVMIVTQRNEITGVSNDILEKHIGGGDKYLYGIYGNGKFHCSTVWDTSVCPGCIYQGCIKPWENYYDFGMKSNGYHGVTLSIH